MKDLIALTIDGQTVEPPENVPGGGSGTFDSVISIAIALFVAAAIIISLAFVIWGGIRWATSSGDKEKIEKARKTIIYAVVALVLTILSVVIINVIGELIGSQFLADF